MNGDRDINVPVVALGLAFRRGLDEVKRFGAIRWGFVKLELGGNGTSGDVGGVAGDVDLGGRGCSLGGGCHCVFADLLNFRED